MLRVVDVPHRRVIGEARQYLIRKYHFDITEIKEGYFRDGDFIFIRSYQPREGQQKVLLKLFGVSIGGKDVPTDVTVTFNSADYKPYFTVEPHLFRKMVHVIGIQCGEKHFQLVTDDPVDDLEE